MKTVKIEFSFCAIFEYLQVDSTQLNYKNNISKRKTRHLLRALDFTRVGRK